MKKFLIPTFLFAPMVAEAVTIGGLVGDDLTAQACSVATCPSDSSTAKIYDLSDPGCSTYTTKCFKQNNASVYLRYKDCNTCKSNATKTTQGLSDALGYSEVCTGVTTVTRNVCDCGTQCDSIYCNMWWTSWSTVKTGYQERTKSACSPSTNCKCSVIESDWRCDAGYYGTAKYDLVASGGYGYSGCTRCPSSGGVYGTSAAGSTEKTSCYIPAGDISWTDSTGTYVCGEDSYFAN